MKALAKAAGRNPDHLLVMPGVIPVVGETVEHAESRLAEMNGFAVHDLLMAKLSSFLGRDLRRMDLDAPLPDETRPSQDNQSSQSRVAALISIARRDGLTLRQLLLGLASGRGHLLAVGTGRHVASVMQAWFENADDGFNVMCPVMPVDLQAFNDMVMPELSKDGLRTDPDVGMLRARYGLPIW